VIHVARALLLGIAVLAVACAEPGSPEERIRAMVARAAEAASAKDLGALVELVSPAYSDADGNRRDDVKRLLAFHVLRAGSLHALAATREVAVDDPARAQAVVFAALARVPIHDFRDLAALDADVWRFDLSLALERGEWRVTGARWHRADVTDLLDLGPPAGS
jgi:hypothetical protein